MKTQSLRNQLLESKKNIIPVITWKVFINPEGTELKPQPAACQNKGYSGCIGYECCLGHFKFGSNNSVCYCDYYNKNKAV